MKKVRNLIIGIVCVSVIVGLFYFVSNKMAAPKEEEEISEVQKLILKDIEGKAYPETPRAVTKLYTRIQTCLYNEEYTDEEFKELSKQLRSLMDQELLDNNPEEMYNVSLQADVTDYKNNKRTISNVTLSESNDVIYKKIDGKECAYVRASYFIREGDGFKRTIQRYILRKDEEERWKVLGFELIEGDSNE